MSELRGSAVNHLPAREKVGLPPRAFLFTLDQVAMMIAVTERSLKQAYVYFEGRSTGRRSLDLMIAINIAPEKEKPEWRVSERELIRWLKKKGFRYYEVGTFH